VILRWYYYGEEFLIQVRATIQDGKDGKGEIGEKTAKRIIYDEILKDLLIFRKEIRKNWIATPKNLP
jgi:hypothetical protein